MCIGIPMQVIEAFESSCVCQASSGELVSIDTLLVGPQQPGNWLMTFLNTAREVLSAPDAQLLLNALSGLNQAAAGESFEHLFADLINREPELPEFLRGENSEEHK